jgi:hypothetical protein
MSRDWHAHRQGFLILVILVKNFRINPENTEEGLSLRARTAYWALPLLHFPKKYQPAKDFPAPTNLGLSW